MYINNQTYAINPSLFESNQAAVKTASSTTFAGYMKAIKSTSATMNSVIEDIATELIFPMDTNKGSIEMNLDDYFEPNLSSKATVNLLAVPLLLPSAHNVDVLANYSQQKVNDLMRQYNIPKPPATIEFDQEGQLILPQDYPYSAQLTHAFNENPQIEKALSTTVAIASHYVGIMEGQPFRDEMSTAKTQADRHRIIEKYNYLFNSNRPAIQIVLSFLDDGSMLIGERGGATGSKTLFNASA